MRSGLRVFQFIAAFLATGAHAQEKPNLDGVVVTGPRDKKAEVGILGDKAIIDTPFSMTVVDAEDIQKRGAKSVRQIFINDPSIYTPASSNTTDWWGMSIRGMPVRNTYADDYPILLYWGGDFPVEAVDGVTALKGATGFMYGFGAPGGVIAYNLKKPQPTPRTQVGVEYRDSSVFSATIDNGGVIAGDLGYRVSLSGEKGATYNKAEVNRYVGVLALEKSFSDRLKWSGNVVYEYSKLEHEPFQFYLSRYDYVGSGGVLPEATYDYDNFNIDNSYYRTKTLIAATGLDYELGGSWVLKYRFGYTRKDHYSNKSFANLLNRSGDYGGNIYNFAGRLENHFSQVMLVGDVVTGPLSHELVAGAGKQRSTSKYSAFYFASTADFVGNIYREQTFRVRSIPDLSLNPIGSDQRQTYGFVSDTVKWGKWQAILGGRYTYFDRQDVNPRDTVAAGYDTRAFTPTLALLYKPVPNATLYASYVESLEPGSVVGVRYANANEHLDATVSTQYELGAKYQNGRLAVEAALFKIKRAEAMDTARNGLLYLTLDGRSTFKGFELNGQFRVTDDLKVGGGFVRLDASIDETSVANRALLGNMPLNAAKWQGAVNAEYNIAAIDGLSLHGVVRYYGDTYVANDNLLRVPDYTVVNAGFSYRFKIKGKDAVLNGNLNNLLNKKYWAGGGYAAGNLGEAINGSLGLNVEW
jgi:iron complex outermembrane receptor protein